MSIRSKEIAEKLNKKFDYDDIRTYHNENLKNIINFAGQNKCVIVMGMSDDIMDLSGAISDEVSAFNGGEALIDLLEMDLLEYYNGYDDCLNCRLLERHIQQNCFEVKAIWHDDGEQSWTITTEVPHDTFEVYEDGELYCKGIVIDLDEAKEWHYMRQMPLLITKGVEV